MSRSRSYVYTLNNYTKEEEEAVQALPCSYHVYGRETGDSGTPHLQGFLHFPNARSFPSVKKLIPRAHLEIARDVGSAILYSKKDGNIWETGIAPKNGRPTEQDRMERNKRLRTGSLNELVASGELSILDVRKLKNARLDLDQEGAATSTDGQGSLVLGPSWYWQISQGSFGLPGCFYQGSKQVVRRLRGSRVHHPR